MNHIDPKASLDTLIRDQLLPLVTDMHDRMATKDDIADIERRMATKDDIADIERRMATKDDIAEIERRMATKDDIAEIERRMATKDELNGLETRLQSMEKRFEKVECRLDDTATKADLAHHPTTPFMVGTIITMVLGICSILIGGIAIAPFLRP